MQAPSGLNNFLLARLDELKIQGLIFDLDGVVTPTAQVHALAWKKMFDDYLLKKGLENGKTYQPMDIATDYPQYLDGISRYNGIRNFLKSRSIYLPEGSPGDDRTTETITRLFRLLRQRGRLQKWRNAPEES